MRHLAGYPMAVAAAVAVLLGGLAGCGKSEEYNRKAYDVCLADGKKPDSKLAKAKFAAYEGAKVASSTGDDQFRVNIPYELNGEKGLFQCIAEKNQDGTFKAVF
jgi:hypothetical protein